MIKYAAAILMIVFLLLGCYGSPIHQTVAYNNVQKNLKKNNNGLLSLNIEMSKEQVIKIMGEPERSEGYSWGSAWLYRTAMTSGVYGTADTDFTPVMFSHEGKLIGWGRNFYEEQIKKYDISIEHKAPN